MSPSRSCISHPPEPPPAHSQLGLGLAMGQKKTELHKQTSLWNKQIFPLRQVATSQWNNSKLPLLEVKHMEMEREPGEKKRHHTHLCPRMWLPLTLLVKSSMARELLRIEAASASKENICAKLLQLQAQPNDLSHSQSMCQHSTCKTMWILEICLAIFRLLATSQNVCAAERWLVGGSKSNGPARH